MALDPAAYRLSDSENRDTFESEIKPDLFSAARPAQRPVAVIFGGQPGSGKSAALDRASDDLAERGGAVQIIGDDLRIYHPANARLMREDDKIAAFYTGPDSGRWVEMAIAYAIDDTDLGFCPVRMRVVKQLVAVAQVQETDAQIREKLPSETLKRHVL